MRKIIIFIMFFILYGLSYSQYLEVRRSANIKELPKNDGILIEKAQKGDRLNLLDSGNQVNGYYRVETKSGNQEGWIYRTLVRRYEGSFNDGEKISTGFRLTFDPPPDNYYEGMDMLLGDSLKEALNQQIDGHVEFSYNAVWNILKETDLDTNDPTRVIGIYSGFSMQADSQSANGTGWNREHVWAKSLGQFGTRKGAGTDVHHIRACDASTNSARRNRYFDTCSKPYIDKTGKYTGPTGSFTGLKYTWEPRDAVKGDVARMIFYMVVRYEGFNGEPDLELTDDFNTQDTKTPFHGRRYILLKWHREDPVDDMERYRNHIIFTKYQKNRNPFIDHPEYVERIWGR